MINIKNKNIEPSNKVSPLYSHVKNLALASVLALTLAGCKDTNITSYSKSNTRIDSIVSDYDPEFDVQLKNNKKNYRNYADLYAGYLGYFEKENNGNIKFGKVTMSDDLNIPLNATQTMNNLWKKKLQRENIKKFGVAKKFYNEIVSKINFTDDDKSDINEYKEDIKNEIDEIKSTFDYEKIKKDKFRNSEKYDLWKDMCDMIDENMILSYNMTELFPIGSPGGKTEYWFLDEILQQYGKEFIFHVPAIHDDYASFGSYQFTSLALYDTGDEKRGASVMNQYLPKESQIPGSVTKLQNNDHHKAAYLFAMYNVFQTLKMLNEQETKNIIQYIKEHQDIEYILPQLIAIGHNYPSDLIYNKKYPNNKKKVSCFLLDHEDGQILYEFMRGTHTEEYARKTFQNYIALKKGVKYINEPIIKN